MPSEKRTRRSHPGTTPDARENQIVSLAYDLAEKQIREGTASSQVLTEFLKRGSTKERIEKEILQHQKELIKAKTESIHSSKNNESLYQDAIDAMRSYSGRGKREDDDD